MNHDNDCHLMYDEVQNIDGWKMECTCEKKQDKEDLEKDCWICGKTFTTYNHSAECNDCGKNINN